MEQRYCHNSYFIGFDYVTNPYLYPNVHQNWHIISKIIWLNMSSLPVAMMYFDYCDILRDISSRKKLFCYIQQCVYKKDFYFRFMCLCWGIMANVFLCFSGCFSYIGYRAERPQIIGMSEPECMNVSSTSNCVSFLLLHVKSKKTDSL